ncbi:uncharacterized protein conserved in bacteria [Candidatus Vecturithrix granuli]|uniref:Uncharacterized protein conserved in bacteria n=1 Tax=Vecturithrix granuli TaxID=1499967 RepID=A0A081BYA4_VECG1|nr:uncharacterized protein conserved in bacteria [Candidatus Vecturithrix granuli]
MEKNVVTGQQLGLLGGPLYTTYKVLGAIHYAREIGGNHIYWLESNDADFSEINHIDYLDANSELRTLTWDIDSQGYSCGLIEVDSLLVALLNEFFDTLRQTEFTPALRELALRCYVPGYTLGKASCLLAKALFGRFDIELFDPSKHMFKAFIKSFLLREAERTPVGEQCNLFCMQGKRRESVFKAKDGYYLRDGSRVNLEEYDLVPNVKTRNVCQDAYFDTHTYIAGPGEVKYIQELDPIYEFHGVRKANVVPRMSVTLLEPKTLRLLNKHAIELQDALILEKPKLVKKVLKAQTGFDYKELTQRARQLTKEYLTAVQQLGVNISKMERCLYEAIKEDLGEQRSREKARLEKTLKDAETLSDLLIPFGQRQERVFNLFYYMNLYGGLALIDWLYARYDPALETLEISS